MSPLQYHLYERPGNLVVLIDVIRATTVFSAALFHGAIKVVPVADIEKAMAFREHGFLTAGERNSYKLEGFDFGNSPLEFSNAKVKGQSIAITTTNGTQALAVVPAGTEVVTGAWVNQQALLQFLRSCECDVLLLCSGWKFATCIEDTLFAGQIAHELLSGNFCHSSDSVSIAITLAKQAKERELEFILEHSPRLKLKYEMLKNDIAYCLQKDAAPLVPRLVEGAFVV
jgi:2-phosphosulfolactate phosphatase